MNYLMKYQEIKMRKLVLFIALLLGFISQAQLKIPEKPSFIPPVIDSTNTLSSQEKESLYKKLAIYSDSTSTEMFVMIVSTTQGEDIARYATDLGQKWQIGQKGKDNGIILLVAKDDRKMTIQNGYGVEHLLTDALSRRIIETVIKPNFKENQYYQGIDEGTNAIFRVLKGEFKNDKPKKEGSIFPILLVIGFVILFLILASKNKGKNGGNSGGFGGPDLMDIIILSSMGRGGGGSFGGGSSGGGFGGFGGGGSFGGGGASGSW
jgi:uncharacterized protein